MSLVLVVVSLFASSWPGADALVEGAGRPDWLQPAEQSKLPVSRHVVQSELWATPEEARADAFDRAARLAQEFIREVDARAGSVGQVPAWLVQDHLLAERPFIEQVEWSYGPMYRAYMLIDLTPEKREILITRGRQLVQRQRLTQLGGVLGFILVCLVTLLGYLRLDDATRGYYSRWLQTGAAFIVLGFGALIVQWFN